MNSYANHKRSYIKMNARKSFIMILSALSIVLLGSVSSYAQVSTAQVSGILKDNTGAILPGVKIFVVDKQTGKETLGSTNENGYYVVSNLQPGLYDVRIEVIGFKKYIDENITLSAGDRVNISPAMEVGAVTEVVSVTSGGGDNVETENATVGQLIDGEQVRNLMLNGRNAMTLLMLTPGAVITTDELDRGGMAFGSAANIVVNGMRSNSLSVTVDGGANQDSGNITSLTNNVSVDFIGEVKIATSAYGAEYGRYGGSHININIKRGGKNFHGTLFEFFRNDALNTRNYFAPQKETLRMNNFGWNLGGPINWPSKNKLFFFAGQEYKRRVDGENRTATIPSRQMRRGDFSFLPKTTKLVYPSNFTGTYKGKSLAGKEITVANGAPAQNVLRPEDITKSGKAVMRMYDELEKIAVAYDDNSTISNIDFQEKNVDIRRQDLIRLDYLYSPKNNFTMRYLYDTGSYYDPYYGNAIPTRRETRRNQATNIQFTWNSNVNSKSINELSVVSNYLWLTRFPDNSYSSMDRYGLSLTELYGNERQTIGIPSFSILSFTKIYGGQGAPTSPVWDGSIRDNFSTVAGNHQLKLGALFIRNRKNERSSPELTGSYYFSTARNAYTSKHAVMDVLLGNFRDYTETNVDKFSYIRFGQYDAYVADTWKALPNLTLDFGVRYSYMGAPYDKYNTMVTFDPNRFDMEKAQIVQAFESTKSPYKIGQIQTGSGKKYNGLIVGGDSFPNSDVIPSDPDAKNLFAGLPSSIMRSQNKVSPRFGFAWDPLKKGDFVLRGGGGIYYGRMNLVSVFAASNPPFSNDAIVYNGNMETLSIPNASLPSSITGINPETTFPTTYNWSLGFQQKLPSKALLDINYVSTQGRHLLQRPNLNQISPFEYDKKVKQIRAENKLSSSAQIDINALRTYEGYGNIYVFESSAASSYHGLQVGLSRRYSKNLSFTVNYTFSKALTDASLYDDGMQDYRIPGAEKSHASFDRNHVFTASYTYHLPFFKDQKRIVGKILGGWQLNGIVQARSGQWLTFTDDHTTGRRRGDLLSDPTYFDPRNEQTYAIKQVKDDNGNLVDYFVTGNFWVNPVKNLVFGRPPADRWGYSGKNNVKGPGYHSWDMGLYKTFKTSEGTNLQFRAEAFNIWNHTNFKNPRLDIEDDDFGTINAASFPRLLQFALKFNF